jgi:hypothetical protein
MDIDLQITDITDGIPGGYGDGQTIHFTYQGVKVRRECWFTDNSGGDDCYYVETGKPWSMELHHLDDEDYDWESLWLKVVEVMDEMMDTYHRNWSTFVNPVIQSATEKSVAFGQATLENL